MLLAHVLQSNTSLLEELAPVSKSQQLSIFPSSDAPGEQLGGSRSEICSLPVYAPGAH